MKKILLFSIFCFNLFAINSFGKIVFYEYDCSKEDIGYRSQLFDEDIKHINFDILACENDKCKIEIRNSGSKDVKITNAAFLPDENVYSLDKSEFIIKADINHPTIVNLYFNPISQVSKIYTDTLVFTVDSGNPIKFVVVGKARISLSKTYYFKIK